MSNILNQKLSNLINIIISPNTTPSQPNGMSQLDLRDAQLATTQSKTIIDRLLNDLLIRKINHVLNKKIQQGEFSLEEKVILHKRFSFDKKKRHDYRAYKRAVANPEIKDVLEGDVAKYYQDKKYTVKTVQLHYDSVYLQLEWIPKRENSRPSYPTEQYVLPAPRAYRSQSLSSFPSQSRRHSIEFPLRASLNDYTLPPIAPSFPPANPET